MAKMRAAGPTKYGSAHLWQMQPGQGELASIKASTAFGVLTLVAGVRLRKFPTPEEGRTQKGATIPRQASSEFLLNGPSTGLLLWEQLVGLADNW